MSNRAERRWTIWHDVERGTEPPLVARPGEPMNPRWGDPVEVVPASDLLAAQDERDGWERRYQAEQAERRELVGALNLKTGALTSARASLQASQQRVEELERERLRSANDEAMALQRAERSEQALARAEETRENANQASVREQLRAERAERRVEELEGSLVGENQWALTENAGRIRAEQALEKLRELAEEALDLADHPPHSDEVQANRAHTAEVRKLRAALSSPDREEKQDG